MDIAESILVRIEKYLSSPYTNFAPLVTENDIKALLKCFFNYSKMLTINKSPS